MVRPLDLSSAAVAELAVEEDFSFAIFAEEPFLLLQFLGHGDTVGPRFAGTPCGVDMLLYAAVDSILISCSRALSQYHCKNPIYAAEGQGNPMTVWLRLTIR